MEERITYGSKKISLFSHDGIHDSQTHLLAPTYFYKELEREIMLNGRSSENFSVIRVVFNRRLISDDMKSENIRAEDILHFSQALQDLTRKADYVARLGINECVILIRSHRSSVEALITRLMNAPLLTVGNSLAISISSVEFRPGEKALGLLNRLDRETLSTH